MTRPYAVDDFDAIRENMKKLKGETIITEIDVLWKKNHDSYKYKPISKKGMRAFGNYVLASDNYYYFGSFDPDKMKILNGLENLVFQEEI